MSKIYSWGIITLAVLVFIISLANYSPGTFLTGWDNLHPEFNFGLNIFRSLFTSWQEYQGLGLVGGMGHAADLPRQIFLWLLSFILPANILRYFYHFLMLFLGSLGVYLLVKNIILRRYEKRELASLVGAVFYLFNLATLQMFYVPFEPFSHNFAVLPWLFLGNLNYFAKGDKRSLIYLFLINIFAVPQGYVGTYFLVTAVVLGVVFFIHLFKKKDLKRIIVAFSLMFVVNAYWFLPNLYFFLYKSNVNISAKINQMSTEDNFLRNKKYGDLENTMLLKGFWFDNVEMDKEGIPRYQLEDWRKHLDNRFISTIGYSLFTLSVIGVYFSFRKKVRGALIFVPVFFLSFTVLANDAPIFSFFSNLFYKIPLFNQIFRFPFTKFAIIAAFCLSLFYAIASLFLIDSVKRRAYKILILLVFILLPIIYLFPVFQGKLFYPKEKAKIPGEYFQVFDFFQKQPKSERIANFPQYTFWGWTFYRWNYSGSGLLWYGIEQPVLDRAFDVWSGEDENYYHEMSYALYSGNQDLFEKLLRKYQIKWLLVDNNVLSYSSQKEIFSSKLQEIIKQSKKISLSATFGKIKIYRVDLETQPQSFVFLASDLPSIGPKYDWNNFDLAYLEYGNYITSNQPTTYNLQPTTIYYPLRSLFTGRKQEELEFQVEDTRLRQDYGEASGDYFSFYAKIPKELAGSKLVIPALSKEEITEIDENDLSLETIKLPEVFLDGELIPTASESSQAIRHLGGSRTDSPEVEEIELTYIKEGNLEVRVPKIKGYYSYDTGITWDLFEKSPKNCDQFNKGIYKQEGIVAEGKQMLRLTSVGSSNCLDFDLPHLSQNLAYLVTLESRNIEGKSLLFSVINKNSQRADLETYLSAKALATAGLPKRLFNISTPGESTSATPEVSLSYFVIPPMEQYGLGYTLHLDNISIGRVKTVNDLGRITVNPIPYRFLTSLKIIKGNINPQPTTYNSQLISVDHPNPSFYQINLRLTSSSTPGESTSATPGVSLAQTDNVTLVLSQSFDKGWHAYQIQNPDSRIQKLFPFLFGKELKDHVLVNNWENGWRISQELVKNGQELASTNIVIIYLPQYLEYIGFVLLFLSFLYIIIFIKTKDKKANFNHFKKF